MIGRIVMAGVVACGYFATTNSSLAQTAKAQTAKVSDPQARIAELETKVAKLEMENEQLKEENELLKGEADGKTQDEPSSKDAFAVGTIYEGTRTDAAGQTLDVTLIVTRRIQSRFDGELRSVNKANGAVGTRAIHGTAPRSKGTVRFWSEKTGVQKQDYFGQLANGELGFKFAGTSIGGGPISGNGLLKMK